MNKFRLKIYDFYLASPFFNDNQILRMKNVLKVLRDEGYEVYAPFEIGVVGDITDKKVINKIFNSNVEAIERSRIVIAITDEKDMGTIWEAGYARGKDIPVVYYCETLGKNPFNIMLSESATGIFKNIESLKEAAKEGKFDKKEKIEKYE